jgi:hypothetical protein
MSAEHEAWVDRGGELAVVKLANIDDGYYVQVFRTRAELEEFIAGLRAVVDEAWPELLR